MGRFSASKSTMGTHDEQDYSRSRSCGREGNQTHDRGSYKRDQYPRGAGDIDSKGCYPVLSMASLLRSLVFNLHSDCSGFIANPVRC